MGSNGRPPLESILGDLYASGDSASRLSSIDSNAKENTLTDMSSSLVNGTHVTTAELGEDGSEGLKTSLLSNPNQGPTATEREGLPRHTGTTVGTEPVEAPRPSDVFTAPSEQPKAPCTETGSMLNLSSVPCAPPTQARGPSLFDGDDLLSLMMGKYARGLSAPAVPAPPVALVETEDSGAEAATVQCQGSEEACSEKVTPKSEDCLQEGPHQAAVQEAPLPSSPLAEVQNGAVKPAEPSPVKPVEPSPVEPSPGVLAELGQLSVSTEAEKGSFLEAAARIWESLEAHLKEHLRSGETRATIDAFLEILERVSTSAANAQTRDRKTRLLRRVLAVYALVEESDASANAEDAPPSAAPSPPPSSGGGEHGGGSTGPTVGSVDVGTVAAEKVAGAAAAAAEDKVVQEEAEDKDEVEESTLALAFGGEFWGAARVSPPLAPAAAPPAVHSSVPVDRVTVTHGATPASAVSAQGPSASTNETGTEASSPPCPPAPAHTSGPPSASAAPPPPSSSGQETPPHLPPAPLASRGDRRLSHGGTRDEAAGPPPPPPFQPPSAPADVPASGAGDHSPPPPPPPAFQDSVPPPPSAASHHRDVPPPAFMEASPPQQHQHSHQPQHTPPQQHQQSQQQQQHPQQQVPQQHSQPSYPQQQLPQHQHQHQHQHQQQQQNTQQHQPAHPQQHPQQQPQQHLQSAGHLAEGSVAAASAHHPPPSGHHRGDPPMPPAGGDLSPHHYGVGHPAPLQQQQNADAHARSHLAGHPPEGYPPSPAHPSHLPPSSHPPLHHPPQPQPPHPSQAPSQPPPQQPSHHQPPRQQPPQQPSHHQQPPQQHQPSHQPPPHQPSHQPSHHQPPHHQPQHQPSHHQPPHHPSQPPLQPSQPPHHQPPHLPSQPPLQPSQPPHHQPPHQPSQPRPSQPTHLQPPPQQQMPRHHNDPHPQPPHPDLGQLQQQQQRLRDPAHPFSAHQVPPPLRSSADPHPYPPHHPPYPHQQQQPSHPQRYPGPAPPARPDVAREGGAYDMYAPALPRDGDGAVDEFGLPVARMPPHARSRPVEYDYGRPGGYPGPHGQAYMDRPTVDYAAPHHPSQQQGAGWPSHPHPAEAGRMPQRGPGAPPHGAGMQHHQAGRPGPPRDDGVLQLQPVRPVATSSNEPPPAMPPRRRTFEDYFKDPEAEPPRPASPAPAPAQEPRPVPPSRSSSLRRPNVTPPSGQPHPGYAPPGSPQTSHRRVKFKEGTKEKDADARPRKSSRKSRSKNSSSSFHSGLQDMSKYSPEELRDIVNTSTDINKLEAAMAELQIRTSESSRRRK